MSSRNRTSSLPDRILVRLVANTHHCVHPSRLTVILVSHFLLDLQRASAGSVGLGATSLSRFDSNARTTSTVVFDRVVGSMGASLHANEDDSIEDFDSGLSSCSSSHDVHHINGDAEAVY